MSTLSHRKEDEPPIPPRHGSSDYLGKHPANTHNNQKKNASNTGSLRGNFYNQHAHSQSMPRLPLASVESPNKRQIPMWDSSDPTRAPPPLPLNPHLHPGGTSQLGASRTSATIAAAHQALHEKALRDVAPVSVSPYTTNQMNPNPSVISTATTGSYASTAVASDRFSPIKSLPARDTSPSPAHRRMQSMQPSVRDIRSAFDARSPDRVSRADTPGSARGSDLPYRSGSPSTPARGLLRATAARNSSSTSPSRSPTKGMNEGTPPSAAMLALQTLSRDEDWQSAKGLGLKETPITNSSGFTPVTSNITPVPMKSLNSTNATSTTSLTTNMSASTLAKPDLQAYGPLSGQIESLTNIATRLQQELAQLSRRSRDNATDLISLKEATNARDEDIRRSLRDLIKTVNAQKDPFTSRHVVPSMTSTTAVVPSPTKFASMPKIGSPRSNFDDDGTRAVSSPSPSARSHALSALNLESPASVAMLEKIIREMVTKEGQERLLESLSQLLERALKESADTRARVDQLAAMVRQRQSARQAQREGSPDDKDTETVDDDATMSFPSTKEAFDFANNRAEILAVLNTIRDSVASSGTAVSDIKSQQRDLRGEILLMGRDLMTKVEEGIASAIGLGSEFASAKLMSNSSIDGDRGLNFDADSLLDAKDDESKIGENDRKKKYDLHSVVSSAIRENLAEFKNSLSGIIGHLPSQSRLSITEHSGVVVHTPGSERSVDGSHASGFEVTMLSTPENATSVPVLDKDTIIEAVKLAYASIRPEIAVHQFGLERDEILQVLREGLEEHRSQLVPVNEKSQAPSKEEVVSAVHEAIKASLEELLPKDRGFNAEELASTIERSPARPVDLAENAIISTVKQALEENGWGGGELSIDQDDIVTAVRAGLEAGGLTKRMASLNKNVNETRSAILSAVQAGYTGITGDVRRVVDQIVRIEWADEERVARDVLLDAVSDRLENMEHLMRGILVGVEDCDDESEVNDGIIGIIRSEIKHVRSAIADISADIKMRDSADLDARKSQISVINESLQSQFDKVSAKLDANQAEDAARAKAVSDAVTEVKGNVAGVQEGVDGVKAEVVQSSEKVIKELTGVAPGIIAEVDKSIATAVTRMQEIVDGRSEKSENVYEAVGGVREMIENLKQTVEEVRQRDEARAAEKAERLKEKEEARLKEKEELAKEKEELAKEKEEKAKAKEERVKAKEERLKEQEERLKQKEARELAEKEKEREDRLDRSIVTALIVAALEETVPRLTEPDTKNVREDLQGVRGDLDIVRKGITDLVEVTKPVDTEDLIDRVKSSLEELKTGLETLIADTGSSREGALKGEITTGFSEGFEGLRTEVNKLFEAASLKDEEARTKSAADLEAKEGQREQMLLEILELVRKSTEKEEPVQDVVLADGDRELDLDVKEVEEPAPDPMTELKDELKSEMKTVEDLLSVLGSKVDAIDEGIKAEASQVTAASLSSASKDDVAHLEELFNGLKESVVGVQASVTGLKEAVENSETKSQVPTNISLATKEDAEAIENVVRNTKARIEEMGDLASKEQAAALTESLEGVTSKITSISENGATKEDVAVVQLLVEDLKGVVEKEFERVKSEREAKEAEAAAAAAAAAEAAEAAKAKAEAEAEAAKSKPPPDEGDNPVLKRDLDVLGVVCVDIKNRIADLVTAQPDHEGLASRQDVEQLVGLINDFRETHDKLQNSYENDILVTAKAFDDRATEAVAVLTAVGGVELSVSGVKDVVDGLQTRLDDLQVMIAALAEKEKEKEEEEKKKKEEEAELSRSLEGEEAEPSEVAKSAAEIRSDIATVKSNISEVKTAADDVKLLLDGLKTEFDDVKAAIAKVESAAGSDHVSTREEVSRAVELITGLQGAIGDRHPELVGLLSGLKDAVALQSTSVEEVHAAVQDVAKQLTAQAEAQAVTVTEVPEISEVDKEMTEKLGKLDGKMDELLAIRAADSEQVTRLDAIHNQMEATAQRLAALVESQSEQAKAQQAKMDEELVALRAEADGLRNEVSNLKLEKDAVQTEKNNLLTEKENLLSLVAALQTERDELATRKGKIAAEVASLETALRLRREEMTEMEGKADRLERRILDGIMDQSRALLLARSKLSSSVSPMSPSAMTARSSTPSIRRPASAVHGTSNRGNTTMLNPKSGGNTGNGTGNGGPSGGVGAVPASRRIFSLNQINNPAQSNPTGSGLGLHTAVAQGLAGTGVKRSNSLRGKNRKSSWGGAKGGAANNAENEPSRSGGGDNRPAGAGDLGPTRRVSAMTDDTFDHDYSTDTVSHDGADNHGHPSRPHAGRASVSDDYDDDDDDSFASSSMISGSDVTYESTYLTTDEPDLRSHRRRGYGTTVANTTTTGNTGHGMDEIEEETESDESASSLSEDESELGGAGVPGVTRTTGATGTGGYPRRRRGGGGGGGGESMLSIGSDADVVKKAQEVGL